jgi:hypothetical protein
MALTLRLAASPGAPGSSINVPHMGSINVTR